MTTKAFFDLLHEWSYCISAVISLISTLSLVVTAVWFVSEISSKGKINAILIEKNFMENRSLIEKEMDHVKDMLQPLIKLPERVAVLESKHEIKHSED